MRKTDCGTVGCAIGWYIAKNSESCLDEGLYLSAKQIHGDWVYPAIVGEEYESTPYAAYRIMAQHFDITEEDCIKLFDPLEYSAPRIKSVVLGRIMKFYEANKALEIEQEVLEMETV